MSTVTGRTYNTTRPRGFAPWNPRAETADLLEEVIHQLELWRPQWPLTGRQVFYGLVGRGALDKAETAYKKVLTVLGRGRRAGLVPWAAIRDDGASFRDPWSFDDPASFWRQVRSDADNYRRSRQHGQDALVELWCEAAGMVPQLYKVSSGYGVPVASSGGFDSITAKYEAANRFMSRDVPTLVLHVGDYDPSGCAIVDSVADDIAAFCSSVPAPAHPDVHFGTEAGERSTGWVEFRRLAVTPDQIDELNLPTAPPKASDRRGECMDETVQAEAISPDQLAEIVTEAIEDAFDMDVYNDVLELEVDERDALLSRVDEVLQ